jgi:hypothetical protein
MEYRIGFLSLFDTDGAENSFVGALLVTDDSGIPVEFRCTQAIKPNALQKSLYGYMLKPYISIQLCGMPLIKMLTNKPELLFVDIPYVLEIRAKIEIPTLLIKKAGESVSFQTENAPSGMHRIEHELGKFQAIILESYQSSNDYASYSGKVQLLFNAFDLAEPFDRMKKSIEILGKNDNRFK